MAAVDSIPLSATSASDPNLPRSKLFTCLACQVAFSIADDQRIHYKTDWHRYNLKRKIAELPSVTAEQFASKVLIQQQKNKEEDGKNSFSAECTACRKTYYSENAYTNHVNSKKHKENEAKATSENTVSTSDDKEDNSISAPKPSTPGIDLVITSESTESDINNIIDAKIASSIRLSPDTDCLFCTHTSENFDENMSHMTRMHSFFIPDIEYLTDLRGLITYLGEKISVGNVCLFCNGKGRGLRSLEAARKHMLDKGHCKMPYDTEDDLMEVVDFYDFSSSYPVKDEAEEENEEDEEDLIRGTAGMYLTEDETEMVLPSGVRIGHRSMMRYYKQSLRPEESRDSVIIGKLITQYGEEFGYQSSGRGARRTRGLIADGSIHEVKRASEAFKEQRVKRDFETRINLKANMLQHHFRLQNPV